MSQVQPVYLHKMKKKVRKTVVRKRETVVSHLKVNQSGKKGE